ncbi:MAG TPA: DMT family transporter [Mycobacterium sp.]|nr:DMT family transporter [Mycobacterium sp.]HTX93786.1 DMT family transporter [Mycobacterium sp.]
MNAAWIIPFIVLGGALQTCGAAMNGQLFKHMVNPWLASAMSFALVTFFFVAAFLIMPKPLPTARDIASMPWWAVIGGLVGAVQVYAGLTLVNRVGAGAFMGFTVTSALIMSLLIDHFGWLRVASHPITPGRALGGVLLICGITLIAKF